MSNIVGYEVVSNGIIPLNSGINSGNIGAINSQLNSIVPGGAEIKPIQNLSLSSILTSKTGLIILAIFAFAFYHTYLLFKKDYPLNQANLEKESEGYKDTFEGYLLSNMVKPFMFGFLDNFGMLVGIDLIEDFLKGKGVTDGVIVSMAGNAISDGIGTVIGSLLSAMLVLRTGYTGNSYQKKKSEFEFLLEFIFIILGCLCVIPVRVLFFNENPVSWSENKVSVGILVGVAVVIGYLYWKGKKQKCAEDDKHPACN